MTIHSGDTARTSAVRRVRDPYLGAAIVIAIAAAVLVLIGTRSGSLTGIDSAAYLSGARSLAGGSGYLGIDLRPITLFPPGFSATLAGVQELGVPAATAARWINAMSLGVLSLMTFCIARHHARYRLTPVLAAAGVAVMPATFGVASAVWSEPIYCIITLGLIWILERVITDRAHQTRLILLAGGVAGLGVIFRYAGLALVVTAIVVVGLATADHTPRIRARKIVVVTLASLVGPAAIIVNNLRYGTMFGPRTASAETVPSIAREIATMLRGWVIGTTHDQVVLADLAVAGVVIAIMVGATLRTREQTHRALGARPLTATVTLVVTYVAYVIASELTTTIDPIGDRLMSPIIAPCLILAALALESFVDAPVNVSRSARVGFLAIVVSIWLVGSASITVHRAAVTAPAKNGYAARWWTSSDLITAVRRLPPGGTITSNNAAGIYLATGRRPIISTPVTRIYRSASTAPPVAAFRTRIITARQPVYLVWERLVGDVWDVTPAQLVADGLHLTPVAQATFGTVYRITA